MSSQAVSSRPAHVAEDTDSRVLAEIQKSEINLAIWLRELSPGLATWLDERDINQIPKGRGVMPAAEAADFIRLCLRRDMPACAERQDLENDLLLLTSLFLELTQEEFVKVRLDRVEGPTCKTFHQDYTGVRLLCTYRGQGTEWAENEAVHFDLLGKGMPNSLIVPKVEQIHQLPRFAVGLLRGVDPSRPRAVPAIAHRSPDFCPRFLFCLEPAPPRELAATRRMRPALGAFYARAQGEPDEVQEAEECSDQDCAGCELA